LWEGVVQILLGEVYPYPGVLTASTFFTVAVQSILTAGEATTFATVSIERFVQLNHLTPASLSAERQDNLKRLTGNSGMLRIEAAWHRVTSRQYSDDAPPFSSSSRQPPEALNRTQRRIFEYITAHPGVHLRQICRELGLAMGDVQYHIHRLERDGRINSARRGFYKFFYSSALFGEKQRDVLSVLSLDAPRELLLNIIEKPNTSQEELAGATMVSQPTVSWHLKRLVDLGILEKQQTGRIVTYRVADFGAAEIVAFLKSYHPTVWEKWSSRLADIFIAYSEENDKK
jgi:DNA-binding MarR family transcriptional regulator